MVKVSPIARGKPAELSITVGAETDVPQLKDGLSAEFQGPDLPSTAVVIDEDALAIPVTEKVPTIIRRS
jgi:hypothetical protein